MSIVQTLNILNRPIKELAMLPQETIMQMAQTKQLPVAYVAPILKVKAEMDQGAADAAAMMAQQQQDQTAVGSGTVIEKIIAQNAMNEAQQSMPMMPAMSPMGQQMPMELPEDSGIAALPVSVYMVPEYAGGGIVAFKAGDLVDGFDYDAATRDIDTASGRMPSYSGMYSGLGENARAIAAARNEFLGPNQSVADLIAYNKEAEERAARRAKQQFNTRLIEAGLLGLGGDSPYFGVNIGRMAPAVKGAAEDVEKQETAREARRKSELTAKNIIRAEDEKTFSQALAATQAEFEADAKMKAANIAANKPTDMRAYVRDKELADQGDPAAARRVAAVEKYLPLVGTSGVRAEAAATQAATAATSAQATIQDRARDNVDRSLAQNYNSKENKDKRILERADARANKESGAKPGDPNFQDTVTPFVEQLYAREEARIRKSPSASNPTDTAPKSEAGVKPTIQSVKGAPAGATIGNLVEGKGYQVLDRNGKVIGYAR